MKHARTLILSAMLSGGLGAAALAQTPIRPPQAPNMPAPESTIPEKIEPQAPSTTGSVGPDSSLSDKLEATGGVIRPPGDVDPGITAPAPVPNPGTTPVIRPPGSAPGNQAVEPK